MNEPLLSSYKAPSSRKCKLIIRALLQLKFDTMVHILACRCSRMLARGHFLNPCMLQRLVDGLAHVYIGGTWRSHHPRRYLCLYISISHLRCARVLITRYPIKVLCYECIVSGRDNDTELVILPRTSVMCQFLSISPCYPLSAGRNITLARPSVYITPELVNKLRVKRGTLFVVVYRVKLSDFSTSIRFGLRQHYLWEEFKSDRSQRPRSQF